MTTPNPHREAEIRQEFEAWWADEIARNGGFSPGADYREWAKKGFMEATSRASARSAERPPCKYDVWPAGTSPRTCERCGKGPCQGRAAAAPEEKEKG